MHAMEKDGNLSKAAFPLSQSQENIWNLETAHPGLPINNISSILNIGGRLDIPMLKTAVCRLIALTPALRTRIRAPGGVPVQFVVDDVLDHVPFFDFTMTGMEGVEEWSLSVAREAMPVLDAPLYFCAIFKRANGTGGVLLKVHHLISDAWSQGLILNRLAEMYLSLLTGKEPDLSPFPPYEAHIQAENAYLASPEKARDEAFWRRTLRDLPGASAKGHEYATVSPVGRRASFPLPERLNRLIMAFCEQHKVSPFAVFYMALSIYLRRVRGQERFCVGVPVINRRTFQEKRTPGMFVTTLPFVNSLDESVTFAEFNEALKADWYELLRHQSLPFSDIRAIAQANGCPFKLFDIALSFQNGVLMADSESRVSFEGRWQYSGYQAESLCVHISARSGDGSFLVDYDYLTQLFSASEIDVLHAYLVNILTDALLNPDKPIGKLRILSEAEEEKVLYTFNATGAPLPRHSLKDTLLRQAAEYPSRVAVIFSGERVTYEALLRRAKAHAQALSAALGGGGNVVALSMPAGAELFAWLCGVILSGNAWLMLDTGQPPARMESALSRCGAAALVTPEGIQRRAVAGAFDPPPADDPVAYLVLTSGSTGEPKAVQIGQRSLLNFAAAMRCVYPRGGVLSATNISFDAFLIESAAALLNARTVVIADEQRRNDPAELARLIRSYAVGFLSMTPSRLAAYLKEPLFARALAHVEAIVCGGESFPEELLRALKDLTDAHVYNQYGPTEATVGVTLLRLNDAPHITLGKPMRNCRLYVLDERLSPKPIGAPGEIYIGGACLAHGYRGDAGLTNERFLQDPFTDGRVYRTGDLGLWTPRGELQYLGRKDSQVKLHGYRIEMGEIEAALLMHPEVTGAAARVFEGEGRTLLCAYYTALSPLQGADLLAFSSAYLPRYMMPAYVKRLPALPVTTNGKTDYARLPAPEISASDAEPETEAEARLAALWRRVLKNPSLGADADYFLSGGDSLNAIEMLLAVEAEFGAAPSMADLFANSTVRRLARLLPGARTPAAKRETGIPRANERETYPLTPAQQRFYVLSALDPSGVSYNMPGAFRPSRPVDLHRLEAALRRLIELDESLRTAFVQSGATVAQRIEPAVPFALETVRGDDPEAAFHAFVRPFDLAKPPLFRAGVWNGPDSESVLLFDMHHIISDGISGALLLERMDLLYRGLAPEMPAVRYRDFACWLEAKDPRDLDAQRAYWKERLKGAPAETDLPFDRPQPPAADGRGAKVRLSLDEKTSARLDALCEARRATPYAFLAAVFGALLSRLSDQRDIVLGSPVSGRRHPDLMRVTGAFINTLPLRLSVDESEPFSTYLSRVQAAAAAMLDHQDLTLDEIVSLADTPREAGRTPLYNVLFSMVPVKPSAFRLGEAELSQLPLDSGAAKLPLTLEGVRGDKGYAFTLEYAAQLLDEGTAALWARAFEAAVRAAVEDAEIPVGSLPAVSPADRVRLVDRPGRLRALFDDTPVDRLLSELSILYPDRVAVAWGNDRTYTFSELTGRAGALAGHLLHAGAKPGDRIGLLTRRDGDLIVQLLSIWMAGCAYVPLANAYPAARMAEMLRVSGASLLLLGEGIDAPEGMPCPAVRCAYPDAAGFVPPAREGGLSYVLFTSGSTGTPKGVMVSHRALSNLLPAGEQVIGEGKRVLCAANVIFDIFATEVWLPLTQGKTVVVADEEEMLLPWRMAQRIRASGVDTVQLTPSRMQLCLSDAAFCAALSGVHAALLIGEPVTPPLLQALRQTGVSRIVNQYGPTEATVFCSFADLFADPSIHIGKPIQNCRFYALDGGRRMVPPTARGELYLAGECLADGYIGREDLTEAAFVPDPFVPGAKMYKTGDVVRLRADGNWDFLGRVDRQIKFNGHRVEIEEISARILLSGMAREAAAAPVVEDGAVKNIRAFLVPSETYGADALDAYLRANLPDYMVPGDITCLSDFPRTANGKTDLRALLAMRPGAPAPSPAKAEEPRDPLLPIWREALKMDRVAEDVSFFKQGGSSLGALMVLSRYYQLGYTLSMDEFYRQPTLREHRARLLPKGDAQADAVGDAGRGEAAFSAPMPAQTPAPVSTHAQTPAPIPTYAQTPAPQAPVRAEPPPPPLASPLSGEVPALPRRLPLTAAQPLKRGDTLLTGATGFFGAHLLQTLTERGERIVCLVRDAGRLKRTLEAYFGRVPDGIEAVEGDIERPRLGLSFVRYADLVRRTARVWHAAADVRHHAPNEELYRTNVTGTETAIAFAADAEAWLGHISTASVSGSHARGLTGEILRFTEQDLDIGQNLAENPYVRTKAIAEARVAAAMETGLPAQIFRVGRLTARHRDGVFQKNPETNAFYRVVRGLIELGAMPETWAKTPVEMTPVDLCAKAAALLSGGKGAVLHLVSPNRVAPISLLFSARGVATLADDAFSALLRARLTRGDSAVLYALAEVFFGSDQGAPTVLLDMERTLALLRAQGFAWPEPNPEVYARCFTKA